MRFYSSSEATEKRFSVNKCPFKDQGYCLGMSKSMSEHYFRLEPKAESKTHFLIGSRAFAELFLQTHHFPSLPLLPGANFIISSLLLLHFNKQSLFPSLHFLSFISVPPFLSPSSSRHPSLPLFITKLSILFSPVLIQPFLVSSL